ncbi:Long-chain-fatty-acid--CoA ligase [Paraburkholderia nemoris]|uniref:long-chain-fatty-acid--CoA ligase n=1 Tax=Paraburkholderia nemoris TaxID=2793076 RepID=UPI001B1355CF|nr:long-chain-fatty-acid--CoA ligase [Paraburkholderia nemoris]MBK3742588.1 long-chain-fatty-acid--CoA ligase [Paraburkholderia aspalathi]CAE6787037.1 Long-chain-fatty-acid--CoA ligase [Paraburkholderia nemoris]
MAVPKLLDTMAGEAYAYPLLIRQLLVGVGQHQSAEIVSAGRRFTYPKFVERLHRLASLLAGHGVRPGDTVAVMDWDSHRYLECYFAVPMMGAVLQTVNVRLTRDVIGVVLRQAGAKVLMYHSDFSTIVDSLRENLPDLQHVIRLSDNEDPRTYEALIEEAPRQFSFEDFDENTIATTFHTTGTTGDPKQVFFSHRQLVLHTLAASAALANQPDGQSFSRSDVYMPMTPMFHVHAWGIPFVATMLGVKQVYPGRYDPVTLLALKEKEGVTFSHGVPTLLRMILDAARPMPGTLAPWTIVVGGSALPPDLIEEATRAGVSAVAGYGMSETGPIIAVARSEPGQPASVRSRAGFPIPLVHARIDPTNAGELVVRAPWLTQGYGVQAASDDLWKGGWLHTQDIAEVDADGGIRIVDRIKDVIKTGGEWVSSIDIEALLVAHPAVLEAAVVGVQSPKWGERPMAFVVAARDVPLPTEDELRAVIAKHAAQGRISRYAVPDRIQFKTSLPRTSVGKIDKKILRQNADAVDLPSGEEGAVP